MRIVLNFGKTERKIPMKTIRDAIYRSLTASNPAYAKSMHDNGIQIEGSKKVIKPFSFSCPYYDRYGNCKVKISTVDSQFSTNLLQGLQKEQDSIGFLDISFIPYAPVRFNNGHTSVKVITLSPIVYKKKTDKGILIMNSIDEDFEESIRFGILSKYTAIYQNPPHDNFFRIKPTEGKIKTSHKKLYKRTIPVITGEFVISASEEMFDIAYGIGIGAKNGMGFGMIEVVGYPSSEK